jgi:sRNA-binding regulator protein Hfq
MSDLTINPRPFKKPPAPKGHEAFLKALEAAGAKVSLTLSNDPDTIMTGTIKHSDKYTISLRTDREDGTYQVYVIFKHAIEMFWTNPNDKTA